MSGRGFEDLEVLSTRMLDYEELPSLTRPLDDTCSMGRHLLRAHNASSHSRHLVFYDGECLSHNDNDGKFTQLTCNDSRILHWRLLAFHFPASLTSCLPKEHKLSDMMVWQTQREDYPWYTGRTCFVKLDSSSCISSFTSMSGPSLILVFVVILFRVRKLVGHINLIRLIFFIASLRVSPDKLESPDDWDFFPISSSGIALNLAG